MALTKQKKAELLAGMKERLAGAKSIAFVNFNALTVADDKVLRRKLRAENVGYFVAKKTLAKIALNDLKAKGEMPELPGEIAIAYSDDLIAPAREVYAFQKAPRDKGTVAIVGGIFDGEFKTQAEMMSIATIPSLFVLRGMFVNLINSPIQRFAIAMGKIAESKGAVPVAKAEVVAVLEAAPAVAEVVAEVVGEADVVVEVAPAEVAAE